MLETTDPKLTAFAFGELPAKEQAEVATLVAASPALASEVAAIRGLGQQLTTLLSAEACPTLSDSDRNTILRAAEQVRPAEVSVATVPAVQPASYRQRRFWIYSTAAAVLFSVTLFFAIPLAVRYTQTPLYRSSAWLRVEDTYANFGLSFFAPDPLPEEPVEASDIDSAEEERVLAQPLAQLQSRIAAKETEHELLKAETKDLEEKLERQSFDIDMEPIEQEVRAKPEVQKLDQEIATLKESIPPLGSKEFAADFPKHIADRKKLIALEHERDKLVNALSDQSLARLTASEKKRLQTDVDKARVRVVQNQLEIDILREKYLAQREELAGSDHAPLDISFKKSSLRREEQVVEMISGRIMRLRTEMMVPAKVTLLRKAEPSSQPDSDQSIWAFWMGKLPQINNEKLPPPSAGSRFMQKQIQLIHSPLVLEQVLARPDVAQYQPLANAAQPVSWLSKRVSVNSGNNSELFIIDFLCDDPNYAALITNAIVEAYFRMHTQDEAQRSTRVVELLEDERARRLVVIQQLRDEIEELEAKAAGKVRAPKENEFR